MGHPNPYIRPLEAAAQTGGLEGLNAEHRRQADALAKAYDRVHWTIVPRPYRDGRFTDEDTASFAEFGFSSDIYTSASGFAHRRRLVFKRGGQTLEVNNFDFYRRRGNVFLWQVTGIDWDTETVTVKRSNIQTTYSLGGE